MKEWTFENDENGEAGPEMAQWLVRDESTDGRDIVAVVPKTGDHEYDDRVTYPNVCLIAAAPRMLQILELMYDEDNHDVDELGPVFLDRQWHSFSALIGDIIAKAKGETT